MWVHCFLPRKLNHAFAVVSLASLSHRSLALLDPYYRLQAMAETVLSKYLDLTNRTQVTTPDPSRVPGVVCTNTLAIIRSCLCRSNVQQQPVVCLCRCALACWRSLKWMVCVAFAVALIICQCHLDELTLFFYTVLHGRLRVSNLLTHFRVFLVWAATPRMEMGRERKSDKRLSAGDVKPVSSWRRSYQHSEALVSIFPFRCTKQVGPSTGVHCGAQASKSTPCMCTRPDCAFDGGRRAHLWSTGGGFHAQPFMLNRSVMIVDGWLPARLTDQCWLVVVFVPSLITVFLLMLSPTHCVAWYVFFLQSATFQSAF